MEFSGSRRAGSRSWATPRRTCSSAPIDWRQLVHTDELPRVQAKLRDHIAGKTPDLRERAPHAAARTASGAGCIAAPRRCSDEDGRLRRLIGVETDITEQKIYEEALFKEKESAQITLQSIGDGVVTTDAQCHVEYLNPVAEELTGWRLDEAAGRQIDDVFRGFHEETCEPLENPLSVAIRRTRPIKSVRPTLLIRRDGNEIYIESTAAPIRNDRGEVTGAVLVFHDVSESRELNRRLSYHASHDILTGLVNRRGVREPAGAGAEERQGAGDLLRAVLPRPRPVQDGQRLLRPHRR